MKTFIKTAFVALSLAAAGIAASAPAASAADARLVITIDGGRHGGWDRHGGRDRHGDWGRHGGRGECSIGRALDKAQSMGLRRARVTEVNRRFVEVSGRHRGDFGRIIFANDRRCPVVAVR
jgi:hypothetical protein